jgi:hypothetical protein
MTTTLSNLTYQVASALGILTEGTATGGSTTTIVDTNTLNKDNNYWQGGTAWVLYDAAGAHASPEGKYSVITASVSSTYTVAFSSVTDAVGAGDRYAVSKKRYPLGTLIEKINEALRGIGIIEMTDTTSLDTSSDTLEYSLPVGANYDLRQVWVQGDDNNSSADSWSLLEGWYSEKSATGSGNILTLPLTLDAGYDIKLVYTGPHPELHAYTDKMDDSIYPQLLVYKAAINCLLWRKQKVGDDDGEIAAQLNKFEDELIKMRSTTPVKLPSRSGKKLILSRDKRLY